ncbi:MAG: hypothetical protein IKO76_00845 [Butyrivibrio sp.]|nr:hypothetical protein [Butyrivibrio sp.]
MRLLNCRLDEVKKSIGAKGIVFFGQGSWLQSVDYTELMELQESFRYVVDNNPKNEVILGGCTLEVCKPERLLNEKDIVIILSSPVYMYDMYKQLEEMKLDESIDCYAFPFMQKVSDHEIDSLIDFRGGKKQLIPKVIHSFWFSGDEKPESYRKCIETWPEILKGYEIKEWNMDNYDWHKHPFLEKAIELKAWAFATDYARLDVLWQLGGIYMDMDVEVIKPFDDLLGNDAILSFSNNTMVDLAVMGARQNNELVKKLIELYNNVEIPNEKVGFSKFFQPSFVRKTLAENGIIMNGCLQKTDYATIFPHEFFMPLDFVTFDECRTENTYCVHYDNFGWSYDADNKRQKKMTDNRKLWRMVEHEQD